MAPIQRRYETLAASLEEQTPNYGPATPKFKTNCTERMQVSHAVDAVSDLWVGRFFGLMAASPLKRLGC